MSRTPWTARQDAQFFDAIADGARICVAARSVGKTTDQGRDRIKYVRRMYGTQAA